MVCEPPHYQVKWIVLKQQNSSAHVYTLNYCQLYIWTLYRHGFDASRLTRWTVTSVSRGWIAGLPSRATKRPWHSAFQCCNEFGSRTRISTMENIRICTPSQRRTSSWDCIKTDVYSTRHGKHCSETTHPLQITGSSQSQDFYVCKMLFLP